MRQVLILALAILVGTSPRLAAQQQKPPAPLPAEIVAAWEKAGAQAGWADILWVRSGGAGKEGEVPAFRFKVWRPGALDGLPQTERGFGLTFRATDFDDAALKELAFLKHLQALFLTHAKITDAGLKDLGALESLQTLHLGYTKVTDRGLKQLVGLKVLQTLHLDGTQVSDAGLKELAGLKSLTRLYLANVKVTDSGVAELRRALPKLEIFR